MGKKCDALGKILRNTLVTGGTWCKLGRNPLKSLAMYLMKGGYSELRAERFALNVCSLLLGKTDLFGN
jgi:hypothetical protein